MCAVRVDSFNRLTHLVLRVALLPSVPSTRHSHYPSPLTLSFQAKTFLFCNSFFYLTFLFTVAFFFFRLHGFPPDCLPILLSISVFKFKFFFFFHCLIFLFRTLDLATFVSFRAHVKITSRIVSFTCTGLESVHLRFVINSAKAANTVAPRFIVTISNVQRLNYRVRCTWHSKSMS